MFTSHLGASLTFFMYINLLIKLSLTILFHSHFNLFNNIDNVICNVDH